MTVAMSQGYWREVGERDRERQRGKGSKTGMIWRIKQAKKDNRKKEGQRNQELFQKAILNVSRCSTPKRALNLAKKPKNNIPGFQRDAFWRPWKVLKNLQKALRPCNPLVQILSKMTVTGGISEPTEVPRFFLVYNSNYSALLRRNCWVNRLDEENGKDGRA